MSKLNKKRLYKEYLESKGVDDIHHVVRIDEDWYTAQDVTYLTTSGKSKTHGICVKDMLGWVCSTFDNSIWECKK